MSNDSVCPREHFKDKPVDVSRSTTDKTQSRAEDTKKISKGASDKWMGLRQEWGEMFHCDAKKNKKK